MSIFNTNAKPPRNKRPLGIDERRTAQHEQGVPIPVWFGTQRIGVTMLTEPFNRVVEPIGEQKKGAPQQSNNYATVVMALGHGPLTVLKQVWVDEDLWWDGPLARGVDEDSVPITIEDFGSGTLYWGTETQPIDPTLDALGIGHPAYRGIAYMVFPKAFLGQYSDSVPHFEVVANRQSLVYPYGAANDLDVNPMEAVMEVCMNPRFGRALADTGLVDGTNIASVATRLNAEGLSLSPILDNHVTLREFFDQIAEYINGWYRLDGFGKLIWGLFRDEGGGGTLVSETDMLSEPVLKLGSWNDTASAAQVVYTNSQRYWMPEATPPGFDAVNATITGITKQPVYERRWITDPSIAMRMANVLAQRNGRPWSTATLPLRPSKFPGLAPGDLLRLAYGHLGLNGQQVRVKTVEIAEPGVPELRAEVTTDVGSLSAAYHTPNDYVPPSSTSLTPVPADFEDLWELPASIGGSNRYPTIALLCAQPTLFTDSFFGWIQVSGGGYDRLSPPSSTGFAVRAKVITAVGTSGNIEVELMGVDVTLAKFSAADFTEGRVVAWCGGETVRVTAFTLLATRQFRLTATRGYYGTTPASLSVDDPVWLVNVRQLYTYILRVGAATSITMKIQPAVRRTGVDLADCDPLTITGDPANLLLPPPGDLQAFGLSSPTWTGTLDIPITWNSNDDHGPVLTVLEFWDPAGPTLVATVTVVVGQEEYVWDYATAVAALGGTPITFEIHAKHRSGSRIGGATVITVTR